MEKEILEKGRLSQIKNKNKDEESKIFIPLLAELEFSLPKLPDISISWKCPIHCIGV